MTAVRPSFASHRWRFIPLNEPELRVIVRAGFVEMGSPALGNLIGLDVLEHLDFGLSHAQRLGYLRRAVT